MSYENFNYFAILVSKIVSANSRPSFITNYFIFASINFLPHFTLGIDKSKNRPMNFCEDFIRLESYVIFIKTLNRWAMYDNSFYIMYGRRKCLLFEKIRGGAGLNMYSLTWPHWIYFVEWPSKSRIKIPLNHIEFNTF